MHHKFLLLKILDWYILKKFLITFLFAIMVLAVFACVIDYSQKVDDFVEHKAPLLQILWYFLNFIPAIVALLYPLFIFIAAIFFTSKMAYRSELIATLASGVSFQRLMVPYILGGLILGSVSLLANHFVVPAGNNNIYKFGQKYIYGKTLTGDQNVHLRLSPKLYVFVANYNLASNSGENFTAETFDGVLLKEKIFADRISYDTAKKSWKLGGVVIRKNDGLKESFESLPTLEKKYDFTPDDLYEDDRSIQGMNTPELYAYAHKEKQRGRENVNTYLFEMHRRTSDAIAGIILTLIAACIASQKIRGGSGFHIAIGIVLSAIYVMFMQFSKTFSINSGMSPLLAAWIPNIIFSFVALYLFVKRVR